MSSEANSNHAGPVEWDHGKAFSAAEQTAIRNQLEQLLADDLFKKSKRYSELLRYLVERTLEGKQDELRERIIGSELYGRSADYDVSLDPAVRVVAAKVRNRLALYYSAPEHQQELKIEIPSGSYVADFRQIPPKAAENATGSQSVRKPLRLRWVHVALVCLVLLLAGAGWLWWLHAVNSRAISRFWRPMASEPVLIVLDAAFADSGKEVAGAAEVAKPSELSSQFIGFKDCCGTVTMLDVHVSQGFNEFLRSRGSRAQTQTDRGTNFADLSVGPSVLVGLNNEWMLKLGKDLPYRIDKPGAETPTRIVTVAELGGKHWERIPRHAENQEGMDFVLVSRIFNASTQHWWVGLAGLTGLGTVRAEEFLTDTKALESLNGMLPKGWEQKNLQMVLAVRMIKGTPGSAQVVSLHCW